MKRDSTWESRLTQEMIDVDEAAVEELLIKEAIIKLMAEAVVEELPIEEAIIELIAEATPKDATPEP